MLSRYQLKIAEFYKFLTGNVKKLVPKFFDKARYVLHNENLQLDLRLESKLKKNTSCISQENNHVFFDKSIYLQLAFESHYFHCHA